MRRVVWSAVGALAVLVAACAGGDGGEVREVLVDYLDDEVASSFIAYFPSEVTVRPGDTVRFKQEWTGEPHSVTMGTMVDEMMEVITPLMEQYEDVPDEEVPPEAFEQFEAATQALPPMMDHESDDFAIQQNAAQPCFLDEGTPPEDPATPCGDEDQQQPAFNGRQSYYNSGYIHYEGPQGNEFVVPLADDIAPGVYSYYCNLHGPGQSGTITVVEPDADIPSQADVARQARAEIEEMAGPLRAAYADVVEAEGEVVVEGRAVPKPLAGYWDESFGHFGVNEFIPRRVEVDAGEAITWHFVGLHTVSFEVPEYFAQLTVGDDGTVTLSAEAIEPVNSPGAPEPPEPPEGEAPPEGEEPPEGEAPPEPVVVDAGEWDGSGFISSGVFFENAYRLTFTEPGTYPYACLIHPQMVGEVVVR